MRCMSATAARGCARAACWPHICAHACSVTFCTTCVCMCISTDVLRDGGRRHQPPQQARVLASIRLMHHPFIKPPPPPLPPTHSNVRPHSPLRCSPSIPQPRCRNTPARPSSARGWMCNSRRPPVTHEPEHGRRRAARSRNGRRRSVQERGVIPPLKIQP